MKLAELLITRKDLQMKLRQLYHQMQSNVKVQEGDEPLENPTEILLTYQKTNKELEELVIKVNLLNSQTIIESLGISLTEAIEKRESLKREHKFIEHAINEAEQKMDHYSHSEIKAVVTIDVKEYHKMRDTLAKNIRKLDVGIQETNWKTEI